jgi:hypothetical protein
LHRLGISGFCFDAFSSREPAATSLENAIVFWEIPLAPESLYLLAIAGYPPLGASLRGPLALESLRFGEDSISGWRLRSGLDHGTS